MRLGKLLIGLVIKQILFIRLYLLKNISKLHLINGIKTNICIFIRDFERDFKPLVTF